MNVTARQLLKYSAALAAASTIGLDLALPRTPAGTGTDAVMRAVLQTTMPVAGVIIEIREGRSERVLGGLARMPHISVYGMKENLVVAVIEGASAHDIEETVTQVLALAGVERVRLVRPDGKD